MLSAMEMIVGREAADMSSEADVKTSSQASDFLKALDKWETSELGSTATKKSNTITKSDLLAFIGKSGSYDDGPFADVKQDIAIVLKAGMSLADRRRFLNPFNINSSSTWTASTFDILDDVSDCDSDACYHSEQALRGDSGEWSSVDAENVFSVMTELTGLYDLKTCLASIREDNGERLFVVHRMPDNEIWRTQTFVRSSSFARLLVERKLPTIIPDMSKDPRFVHGIDAQSQSGRVFAQAPIGWKDDGRCIGVLNLIGNQALLRSVWQDYDLLMRKANEIGSSSAI